MKTSGPTAGSSHRFRLNGSLENGGALDLTALTNVYLHLKGEDGEAVSGSPFTATVSSATLAYYDYVFPTTAGDGDDWKRKWEYRRASQTPVFSIWLPFTVNT